MTGENQEIESIVRLLKDEPNNADLWHKFGVALLAVGRVDEAENAFKHCLKIDTSHALALGDLGSLYTLKGNLKEAVKYLKASTKRAPENHEYWMALGVAYARRNKLKDAIDSFERCLSIQPDYYDAILSLGLMHYRLENWKEALQFLKTAHAERPEEYETLRAIARCQLKLNLKEDLEQTYLSMLEQRPEEHILRVYLGQLAFESGRREEGLKMLYEAVEKDGSLIMGWKVLGEALSRIGRTTEARMALEKYKILMKEQKKITRLYGH